MTTTTFSHTGAQAITVKASFTSLWRWLVPLMLAAVLLGGVQGTANATASSNAAAAFEANVGQVGDLTTSIDDDDPLSGLFTRLDSFVKNFARFMTGPVGLAVMLTSIVVAFATWSFAPKNGIFGPVLRVMASGIAIINAGTLIASISGFI